jgi:hypothetical protein
MKSLRNSVIVSTIMFLLFTLLYIHQPLLAAAPSSFKDVKSTDWFYKDVMEASRLNLVAGVGNNSYAPTKTVSYAEYITVLMKVLGVDTSEYPSGKHWASRNIEAAIHKGIIDSVIKTKLDSAIPRQDMARFTCKALNIEPINDESIFTDAVNSGDKGYINAAYTEFLLNGLGRNENGLVFGYNQPLSRSQLASVALNIKSYIDNPENYKKERAILRQQTEQNLPWVGGFPGNTCGNLINLGHFAKQGDWIYFRSPDRKLYGLYKMRTDGTQKTRLNDDYPRYINVIGDWVYYISSGAIYKVRTDGTDRTLLYTAENYFVAYLNVVGDWMYFKDTDNSDSDFNVYKLRTDGTDLSVACDDQIWGMYIANGWIYYINWDDSMSSVFKIRTDGTEKTRVFNDYVRSFNVEGNWLYYIDFRRCICKVRLDGTGYTEIYKNRADYINVVGDWIYFGNFMDLYKVRTDGTGLKKLSTDNAEHINVVDDWVYYLVVEKGDFKDYMIRTNGTGRQALTVR